MKKNIIDQIIHNQLNFKNCLFEYNFQQNFINFFKNLIINHNETWNKVFYLCFENLIDGQFLNGWGVTNESNERLQFIDPYQYSDNPDLFQINFDPLFDHIKSQYQENSYLVIDSLPFFWDAITTNQQFRYIQRLSDLFQGKLLLLLPQNTMPTLQYSIESLCSTKIQCLNLDHLFQMDLEFQEFHEFDINLECNHSIHYVMQVHHSVGGKLVNEKTIVKWDDKKCEFDTIDYRDLIDNLTKRSVQPAETAQSQNSIEALTSNLSFNLNLTDKQKSQKDALILPYVKTSDEVPSPSADEPQAAAKTVYYPDEGDDWDDEDPDDDLDI